MISKQGGGQVREVLYMAAIASIRWDCTFSRDYHRLVGRGKNGKVAICAVMRKMLVTMRSLLINDSLYDPHFNAVEKQV